MNREDELQGIIDFQTEEIKELKTKTTHTCNWSQCEGAEEVFSTGCGRMFEFTSDGPKENHFTHCPYCGGRLKLEPKK